MRRINARKAWQLLLIAASLTLSAGCTYSIAYSPDYVKPEVVDAKDKMEGKVLVYMDHADAEYVYKGSPSTMTGSATTLTVPVGIMTREITKAVWAEHFTGGADVASSLEGAHAYRAIVRPHVVSFTYAYHQLENLGFAITPGVTISLEESLVNESGVSQWSRSYNSGEVKAGSYMLSFKPEEKVNRLAHQIIADQTRRAVTEGIEYLKTAPAAAATDATAGAAAPAATGCSQPSPVDQALCRGQIAIGMKRTAVLTVLGQPTARSEDAMVLRYGDRYLRFDQDDQLQSVTEAR